MIGPGMTNLMVLFDNQQLGDKKDRKRTSWGFKMEGYEQGGSVDAYL
jgi:hypothetical protein